MPPIKNKQFKQYTFFNKSMNTKYFFLALVLCTSKVICQNIPIGAIDLAEQRARNEQLLGKGDSLVSFTMRPLTQNVSSDFQNKFVFHYLPVNLKQQYTSFAPISRNDGAMIPAKGYQTHFKAGIQASYGALEIRINPEYVYAANRNFEAFPTTETNNIRFAYISYLNHSDIPVRFGDKAYHYLGWGQSSVKLNYKNIAIGVSTENLWWGPGLYNSLIMSNNAPGFLHSTINTRKPIQTFIGSFEGQLINGRLENSGFDNPIEDYIVDGVNYRIPKQSEWRYLSGLSINYHPKWVPGLFVGLNRVFQIYNTDLGKQFTDYFPVITPFQKANLNNEDAKNRDQLASVFLRWVMKESKSEIYVESGWNDHSSNLLDLFDSPSHSRAILFGFGKIFMLNSNNDNYLKFNFEHTQLQQSADRIVRPAGAWYEHGIVLHGYTQMGQVIGASIGPGGNSQILDFSVWNKNKVWGIQCERYAHNLDFYYDVFSDYNRKWVDLNLNTYTYRRIGNIGIQAKLNTSWMHNYQWQLDNNKLNIQIQFALQYHLQ
jgi:hypothetical protein